MKGLRYLWRTLTILLILVVAAQSSFASKSAFIFDYSDFDFYGEAVQVNGLMEYYEGRLLTPQDFVLQSGEEPKIINFPNGLISALRMRTVNADSYGTLRFIVKVDQALMGSYQTMRVNIPASHLNVYINGNAIYQMNAGSEELLEGKIREKHYIVFKVTEPIQEVVIQFNNGAADVIDTTSISLGSIDAINRLINAQVVIEIVFFAIIFLVFLVLLLTLVIRRKIQRIDGVFAIILSAFLLVVLRALSIGNNVLLNDFFVEYPSISFQLRYAGLILVLPMLTIYMNRCTENIVPQRLWKMAWPLFWMLNAIILLANPVQLLWIALASLMLDFGVTLYYLIRCNASKNEMAESESLVTFATLGLHLLLTGVFIVEYVHVEIDARYVLLILAIFAYMEVLLIIKGLSNREIEGDSVLPNNAEDTNEIVVELIDGAKNDAFLEGETVPVNVENVASAEIEQMIKHVGVPILAVNSDGVVVFATQPIQELFVDYSQVLGLNAADLIFGDRSEGNKYLNAVVSKLNRVKFESELEPYILFLPDELRIGNQRFKIDYLPVFSHLNKRELLIWFTDLSELKHTKELLQALESAKNMITCVYPEHVVFRRFIDDFQKMLHIDLHEDETLSGSKLGCIISRLKYALNQFVYYRMGESVQMMKSVMSWIESVEGKFTVEQLLSHVDESAISKDLSQIKQFIGHTFEDAHRHFTVRYDDLIDLEYDGGSHLIQSREVLLSHLKRKHLNEIQPYIYHYCVAMAQYYGKKIHQIDVRISDIKVSESLFHDVYQMIVHGVNNVFEHGGNHVGQIGVNVEKINDLAGNWIRISITDDGVGADDSDLRSQIYSDRIKDFGSVMEMSPQEVLSYLFYPGFAINDKLGRKSNGHGLTLIQETAKHYAGGTSVENLEPQGFQLIIQVPHDDIKQMNHYKIESFIRSLGQSTFGLFEYLGAHGIDISKTILLPTTEKHLKLEEYSAVQTLFCDREIQITLTANYETIETVSRVYGVNYTESDQRILQDVINEMLNMIVGGAIRMHSELAENTKIGMPINIAANGVIYVKGEENYMLHIDEGDLRLSLLVVVN